MQLIDIQRFMAENNIKNVDVCRDLDMTPSYVSKVLSGKSSLSMSFIAKFKDYYGYKKQGVEVKQQRNKTELNILHVPESVQAGIFKGNPKPIDLQEMIPYTIPDISFEAFSFDVDGKSMEPTLYKGEKVIVSRESDTDIEDIVNDYIYVLDTTQGLFIKRIRKQPDKRHIWLVSDNSDFDDVDMALAEIRGIYKVRRVIKWNLTPVLE